MSATNLPDSLHLPAEWEPQEAIWLIWPPNNLDWPSNLSSVHWAFGELVRVLATEVRVEVITASANVQTKAERILRLIDAPDNYRFHRLQTNRSWIRDSGAIATLDLNASLTWLCWRFTGWGRYPQHQRDAEVARFMTEVTKLPSVEPGIEDPSDGSSKAIVMEGGAIDSNGQGLLLTVEECLLSQTQQRNPTMSKQDYENVFGKYFGTYKCIWLPHGLAADDTHGHIDGVARFVKSDVIVVAEEVDSKDPNHQRTRSNLEALKHFAANHNSPIKVVPVPLPRPLIFDGVRWPASYMNFIFANNKVIVPTFNDPADKVALSIFQELLPERQVCGIHARDLIVGGGSLHCLTQQQPVASVD